jgi:cell division protein ZapE
MMYSDSSDPPVQQRPLEIYRQDLERGIIVADAAQAQAIAELEKIHAHLLHGWQSSPSRWQRLKRQFGRGRARPHKGLYLWGGVGRGKTYLMDLFFHALPGERRMRMHFHRFMLMVHSRLAETKGISNPLVGVAGRIAQQVDVICFDEFHVADIGDAMILANLLDTLFASGVILVTTSNIEPDRLYENGLQRQMFLPAIALLKQYTTVLNVDGGIDYRLRSLDKVPVFHHPLGPDSARALDALFTDLTRGLHTEHDKLLDIQQRQVRALRWSEGQVWFDFATLCGGPRGAADYIEIAGQYHTVFISDIPVLQESSDDKARRFITLVDEFYDHRVKLVLSAAAGLDQLYQGGELRCAFARTRSRLLEMQTREYLGSPHNPD